MITFEATDLYCPEFQIQMRRFLLAQTHGSEVLITTKEPRAIKDTQLFCEHSDLIFSGAETEKDVHYILVTIPQLSLSAV